MLNRIFPIIALVSLISFGSFASSVYGRTAIAQVAQESVDKTPDKSPTVPSDKSPELISPEKRALIKELLEITESSKAARQVMDAMVRAELPKLVSTILKNIPALNNDSPEVQKQISDIVSRMAVKYRDRVAQKINLDQLIEEVSYPVYNKYFTESELRDIIGFYKSETGKKAIGVMPQLLGESMRRTNEILLPKMGSIMAEIVSEELLNALPQK
ncbi:DUF2059 domain-containing protein [Pseudanabaena sp. 'Roaring Creek']|uniref:DUF2059 domain-containing protein n=1 Tax=Pseudanabaena sp. 'Roaring Creek' TaxID=1681830 RepID=UPI0006D7A66E|nr:DUF2059 domain-containing protein [Pseudanabaena sp. 'Roaring Creek']